MKFFYLGLLVLALAFVLLLISLRKSRKTGLPAGRIVYADTSLWQKLPKPLYDPELNLTGKPDYVIALKDGSQIPVEVKSAAAPAYPYKAHVIQLAAYCWLLEKSTRMRPEYGLLRYRDKTFQVDYTSALERELIDLISRIRIAETENTSPKRSHNIPARCQGCGYRSLCDQSLSD